MCRYANPFLGGSLTLKPRTTFLCGAMLSLVVEETLHLQETQVGNRLSDPASCRPPTSALSHRPCYLLQSAEQYIHHNGASDSSRRQNCPTSTPPTVRIHPMFLAAVDPPTTPSPGCRSHIRCWRQSILRWWRSGSMQRSDRGRFSQEKAFGSRYQTNCSRNGHDWRHNPRSWTPRRTPLQRREDWAELGQLRLPYVGLQEGSAASAGGRCISGTRCRKTPWEIEGALGRWWRTQGPSLKPIPVKHWPAAAAPKDEEKRLAAAAAPVDVYFILFIFLW